MPGRMLLNAVSSMLAQITPVILTYNEAPNIGRLLEKLTWARDIVVVDSLSTDSTVALVTSMSTARLFRRPFDSHAMQWTYALTQTGIKTEWVLALDADYILTDGLVAEMAALEPEAVIGGYSVRFDYCVAGEPLRGSLYPRGTVLFRRSKARYVQHGHTQHVVVDGTVGRLVGRIRHDDRKPLARWLSSQQRYARLEAEHLLSSPYSSLGRADRIRLLGWPAPILVFLYALFWKGCLLDGWRGWLYVLQRTMAETMIALEIVDRKLGGIERKSAHRGADGSSASMSTNSVDRRRV
jgi:glycosyltransferase involved in cell wall biosynthesis